jgi:hypothetical protein
MRAGLVRQVQHGAPPAKCCAREEEYDDGIKLYHLRVYAVKLGSPLIVLTRGSIRSYTQTTSAAKMMSAWPTSTCLQEQSGHYSALPYTHKRRVHSYGTWPQYTRATPIQLARNGHGPQPKARPIELDIVDKLLANNRGSICQCHPPTRRSHGGRDADQSRARPLG